MKFRLSIENKCRLDIDWKFKWWWNEEGQQLSIEMKKKKATIDSKWKCRLCLSDCLTTSICLFIWLSIEMKKCRLSIIGNTEKASHTHGRASLWSKGLLKMLYSFRALIGILLVGQLFVLPRISKMKISFLSIWLSIEMKIADWRLKRKLMPFLQLSALCPTDEYRSCQQ